VNVNRKQATFSDTAELLQTVAPQHGRQLTAMRNMAKKDKEISIQARKGL
jgi:hypothetical protein